ncbi:MAG: peptidase S8 and S53 subtilisin kexin sedolisin [Harvfovirus sp.]|uniref:Peptidase S8 and S53 subtilisin kexin sedolisin n=1 Tax=Harvfovirus sp. TaxID=2487768 RepID=A0A3G5A0S8_9VIRU|nr:MAG: peptidase S8 and S53 subtilisin kexin sedolisin [Harvfovirus sp.]
MSEEKVGEIVFRPHVKVRDFAGVAVSGGYNPSQIRDAYGLNKLESKGVGSTIAIIDAYSYPNAQADLNKFSSSFGLPGVNIILHGMLGTEGQAAPVDDGWSMEQALDIQWAHAAAPGANIMLVQAYSSGMKDLFAAIDYAVSHGANIVSMSWGGSESKSQLALDAHFENKNVVFVASAGDVGSVVEYPSCSPYVMAIGGTSLKLSGGGERISETGWSGSGGGVSLYEKAAEYQIKSVLGTKGSMREVPDVAAVADPATGVSIFFTPNGQTGSFYTVGGTSLSAPLWAGFLANANEFRAKKGKGKLTTGEVLTALYALPKSEEKPVATTDIFDVEAGSSGKFVAKVGYDLVTGIGSPNLAVLIPECLAII